MGSAQRPALTFAVLIIALHGSSGCGTARQTQPGTQVPPAPSESSNEAVRSENARAAHTPDATPCAVSVHAEQADVPSRVEVIEQMQCIQTDVGACIRDRERQTLSLQLAIAGSDGRAQVIKLEFGAASSWVGKEQSPERLAEAERPAAPETVHCVERALARARFAPFKRESFTVTFPFKPE